MNDNYTRPIDLSGTETHPVKIQTHRSLYLWLGAGFVTLLIAATILFIAFGATEDEETIVTESHTPHETYSPLTVKKDPSQLSYGSWSGELRFGQPHGHGTLTFSQQRLVSQFDARATVAKPGDYVIGEYDDGQLISGKLYRTDGQVVEIVADHDFNKN